MASNYQKEAYILQEQLKAVCEAFDAKELCKDPDDGCMACAYDKLCGAMHDATMILGVIRVPKPKEK